MLVELELRDSKRKCWINPQHVVYLCEAGDAGEYAEDENGSPVGGCCLWCVDDGDNKPYVISGTAAEVAAKLNAAEAKDA